ncbi:MAG TPA: branched-chain amino acid ABC transporter permease [Stellaceae bacterium]|nr:branched-chain amino acid ABC transporter permease [Stellaceae bacterium]
MTAATISRGRRHKRVRSPFHRAMVTGLVFGIIAVYLAVVGILPMIHERAIIVDLLTMAQTALLAIGLGAGAYLARGERHHSIATIVLNGLIAGAVAGGLLALLVVAMNSIDLRSIFISLSPATSDMLTLELGLGVAVPLLVVAGAVLGVLGVLLAISTPSVRKPVLVGCMAVLFFGVFQELIQIMMQFNDAIGAVRDVLYTWEGLTPEGAAIIFIIATGASLLVTRMQVRSAASGTTSWWQSRNGQFAKAGIAMLVLILLPILAGSYIGQVLMLVGLYILMGMGLNLEVGLAGLLDLGFVAFFAVGAYTTALLTADSPHALAAFTAIPHMSFWMAMPIAVLISVMVGVLFGIPVLGVRGDYLAVATMGLGEIVRVVVQSDAAAPLLAGAQGILQIPKPRIGGFELADPVALFFLTLVCAGFAAYCAWRLESSRLGRAWMAVRDDEDVAQALGINLVKVKLLAYGLGAAFAGLSGSIFAVMLTSVYPSSFQLLVSINVLALIIVGGMGSLPGVIVGSLALVGLPELLREFGEYRYLFYGVALIVMMRIRPEGLWPSATRRRELHDFAGDLELEEPPPAVVAEVAAHAEHRPGE